MEHNKILVTKKDQEIFFDFVFNPTCGTSTLNR